MYSSVISSTLRTVLRQRGDHRGPTSHKFPGSGETIPVAYEPVRRSRSLDAITVAVSSPAWRSTTSWKCAVGVKSALTQPAKVARVDRGVVGHVDVAALRHAREAVRRYRVIELPVRVRDDRDSHTVVARVGMRGRHGDVAARRPTLGWGCGPHFGDRRSVQLEVRARRRPVVTANTCATARPRQTGGPTEHCCRLGHDVRGRERVRTVGRDERDQEVGTREPRRNRNVGDDVLRNRCTARTERAG